MKLLVFYTQSQSFLNDFTVMKYLFSAKNVFRDSFGQKIEDCHNYCKDISLFFNQVKEAGDSTKKKTDLNPSQSKSGVEIKLAVLREWKH